jgi:hypothetical protein
MDMVCLGNICGDTLHKRDKDDDDDDDDDMFQGGTFESSVCQTSF